MEKRDFEVECRIPMEENLMIGTKTLLCTCTIRYCLYHADNDNVQNAKGVRVIGAHIGHLAIN